MVEVFKTNVEEYGDAQKLVAEINGTFNNYRVNFDLEDCDRILRVESVNGAIQSPFIIQLLGGYGFKAEVLPEDEQSVENALLIIQDRLIDFNEEGTKLTNIELFCSKNAGS